MRIVSLLACTTEMLFALDLGHLLVGRSHECDFPPQVLDLPVCSRPSFPDGSSADIDREVRSRVAQALSLYELDLERIKDLQPDLILTQDQCQVCAVTLQQVKRSWLEVDIFSLHPHRLEEVFQEFLRLGQLLKVAHRAEACLKGWRERLSHCRGWSQPRVVALEWLDPLMGCGGWTPELIAATGAQELLGRAGQRSRRTSREEIAALQPEILILMPCGFNLYRTIQEAQEKMDLRTLAPRGLAFDGNAYFNRSGPRLVDSAEQLALALGGESTGICWKWLW